jgi:hypothetical protein
MLTRDLAGRAFCVCLIAVTPLSVDDRLCCWLSVS